MMERIYAVAWGWVGAGWVCHWLAWRFLKIRKELLTLTGLMMFLPIAGLTAAAGAGWLDGREWVLSVTLAGALASVYIVSYQPIKQDNPTFEILFLLEQSGARGLADEELAKHLSRHGHLFDEKIDELIADGLAEMHDGRLRLKGLGSFFAVFFGLYRRLLDAPEGKG